MHKNLHLALLDNLMDAAIVPRFDRNAFFLEYRREPFDPDCNYDFKPLLDVEAFLLRTELRAVDLAQLEEVSIDPGQRLQQDIFPQWSGEDAYFDIPTLDGLQQCTNAKVLWLELLPPDDPADIEALRQMPLLKKVTFNGGHLANVSALGAIPDLRRLEFIVTRINDTQENRKILENLRRNGCQVENKSPRGMTF